MIDTVSVIIVDAIILTKCVAYRYVKTLPSGSLAIDYPHFAAIDWNINSWQWRGPGDVDL